MERSSVDPSKVETATNDAKDKYAKEVVEPEEKDVSQKTRVNTVTSMFDELATGLDNTLKDFMTKTGNDLERLAHSDCHMCVSIGLGGTGAA